MGTLKLVKGHLNTSAYDQLMCHTLLWKMEEGYVHIPSR